MGIPHSHDKEDLIFFRHALHQRKYRAFLMQISLPIRRPLYRLKRGTSRLFKSNLKKPSSLPAAFIEFNPTSVNHSTTSWLKTELLPIQYLPETIRLAGARRTAFQELEFSDDQDLHAFHRLYWLLEGWDSIRELLLRNWLTMEKPTQAQHPYSVSERICSISGSLSSYGNRLPSDLQLEMLRTIARDAAFLHCHLETNLGIHNHLLNNARALYIASHMLPEVPNSADWRATAFALWDEFWPQLILDDGLLREQSSHYHMVLGRTLLLYLQAAESSGRKIPERVSALAPKYFAAMESLMRPDGSIPLFGDISPDMPSQWLIGLPKAAWDRGHLSCLPRCNMAGYSAGLPITTIPGSKAVGESQRCKTSESGQWKTQAYLVGGLVIARHPGYGIELHIHADPRTMTECHGDAGRGSYEIWHCGRKIIVDGGVPSYDLTDTTAEFKGPHGQNILSINGFAPALSHEQGRRFPKWYMQSQLGGLLNISEQQVTYIWEGFSRLIPGLIWSRTWAFSNNSIRVEDEFKGNVQPIQVESLIHFGISGWSRLSNLSFSLDEYSLFISSNVTCRVELKEMSFCPDYGVILTSQGIEITAMANQGTRLNLEVIIGATQCAA